MEIDQSLAESHANQLEKLLESQVQQQREFIEHQIMELRQVSPPPQAPDDIDLSLYFKTTCLHLGQSDYLIDERHFLYDVEDNNTIVGRMVSEGQYEWF